MFVPTDYSAMWEKKENLNYPVPTAYVWDQNST